MGIDDAIDRFCAAIETAGLERPRSSHPSDVLDAIAAAVAPLGVPDDLRRVWERLEPSTVRYRTQPELTSAAFALQTWRQHEREPGQVPRVLFPLAYESWQFAFVELHGAQQESGGAVFRWEYAGSDFYLTHDSVEDWFRAQTAALAGGQVTRSHGFAHTEYVAPAQTAAALLERRGPHPVYGTATALPEATMRWPEHWLAGSGRAADRQARGRTHTIDEAPDAFDRGETVRVHALVTGLVGASWTRVKITDGTGELDVACPPHTCAFGPIINTCFEFELAAGDEQPADERPPSPQQLTGIEANGALADAYGLAAERLAPWQERANATARAIRPLN